MARPARAQGYSRRHRFTTRGSFGPVLLRGQRKLRGELAVLHVVSRRGSPSRFGIALTRRILPAASDRNRVKRLAREIFRAHAAKHCGFDCVVALRRAVLPAEEKAFRAELGALLDQLCVTAAPR